MHTNRTLYDSRDEACVDGTADDGVDNNELTAPLEVDLLLIFHRDLILLVAELIGLLNGLTLLIRLNDEVHLTELTGTTGLLLMTIVGTCSLGDRLTIRDLRLEELDRHLIVVLQTPFEGTEVELTLTGNDHLTELFTLLYDPCRILLVITRQERSELLGIGLRYRLDSAAVTRLRIADRRILEITTLNIEGIARTGIFEFHGCTDVACCQLIYRHTDRTGYLIELRDTLFRTTLHVLQVVTVMDRTLHYAEVVDLTDMRLNRSLEDIYAGRRLSVRADLLAVHGRIAEISRTRSHTVEEVHQAANTHILESGAAEHRIHRTVRINGLQTLHNLFVGQTFAEELIEERLICLGSSLRELGTHLFNFICVLRRDVLELRSTALCFPNEHLALEHIDHGIEACAGIDRELDQGTFISENVLELIEGTLKIGILMVAFIDHESERLLGMLHEAEVILGTHLYTTVGAEHHEGGSAHLKGRNRTAAEVIRTCAVNDIEFLTLKLDVTNRGKNGIAVLFLNREIVADSRLRFNRSAAFDHPALEQHRLHESRLTGS